jgi:DNA-binding transcriptional LysR family regulator
MQQGAAAAGTYVTGEVTDDLHRHVGPTSRPAVRITTASCGPMRQSRNSAVQECGMDWDDVRVFLAIAHATSLAAGARAAGLDRSTASRRIVALERALGARLFLRTRDGLRLAPAGQRLVGHAELMSSGARALEASALEDGGELRGRVRLATTDSLAAMLVRGGLIELATRHPRLELELLGDNRVVDLARGEADLALRVAKVHEPSLRVQRVARLPFGLVASERYLVRAGRPKTERDLAGHDVITYADGLAALPEAKWLRDRGGTRVVLRTTSVTALLSAVLDGAGLAVIAGAWGASQLGLTCVFEIPSLPPRALWLAMHPDAASRAAVRAVAEHVHAIVKRGERFGGELARLPLRG